MSKSQKFFCAVGVMVVGHHATLIGRTVVKTVNIRLNEALGKRSS